MDQVKIGQWIATVRKQNNLTQRQLADFLGISDKTVSKWERGKGLPEVSLMLPLCQKLGITVNDLLSGERVSPGNYQKRAEENMMNLIRENRENKMNMVLAIICGGITVIAVCALVLLASYVNLPVAVRLLLLVLALVTAVVGIGAACVLDVRAGYYQCPHCKQLFVPSMGEYVKGYHTFTKRRLTCPHCGKTSMCRHKIVR